MCTQIRTYACRLAVVSYIIRKDVGLVFHLSFLDERRVWPFPSCPLAVRRCSTLLLPWHEIRWRSWLAQLVAINLGFAGDGHLIQTFEDEHGRNNIIRAIW